MHNSARDRLGAKITALERKLEQLRILRSSLDDSELAAEIQEVFAPEEGKGAVTPYDKPLSANMETPDEPENSALANEGKNPAAVALGRLGGQKGGLARAAKLTAEQKVESARNAAKARWKQQKKKQ